MSIYLNIPGISGNVSTQNYKGAIEIFSYSLSADRDVRLAFGAGNNRSLGGLSVSSLHLCKALDNASTALLAHFYSAKPIQKCEFHHVIPGKDPKCYLTNTFY